MSSVFRLLATVYPGAYRFVVINLIAYFFTQDISDSFSQAFFVVSLLATFSGMAVSSQAYVKGDSLKFTHKILLVTGLLIVVALIGIRFWQGSFSEYSIIVLAAFGLSVFEVVRTELAANGKFKLLTIAGALSLIALIPILIFIVDSTLELVFFIFISLMISVLIVDGGKSSGRKSISVDVIKDVFSYSLSNGLSTGVTFIIPLMLIGEFGTDSATDIAQVFTFSTLFFFYPRFLSAGFMVEFKCDPARQELLPIFRNKILVYIFGTIVIYVIAAYYFNADFYDYIWLFIAMQLSQLSLPYANANMVLGKGIRLLKVNLIAMLILAVSAFGILILLEEGANRGYVLTVLFSLYTLFRYFLTKQSIERFKYI